jgi:hypothetical protein
MLFKQKVCFYSDKVVVGKEVVDLSFYRFLNDEVAGLQVFSKIKTRKVRVFFEKSLCLEKKTVYWWFFCKRSYSISGCVLDQVKRIFDTKGIEVVEIFSGGKRVGEDLSRLLFIRKICCLLILILSLFWYFLMNSVLEKQLQEIKGQERDLFAVEEKVKEQTDVYEKISEDNLGYIKIMEAIKNWPLKIYRLAITSKGLYVKGYVLNQDIKRIEEYADSFLSFSKSRLLRRLVSKDGGVCELWMKKVD